MSCDYIWKFTWTKFSYVIASVRPSGMKKLINISLKKSTEVHSIDRRYFYCIFMTHMAPIFEKKKPNVFTQFNHFMKKE